MSSVSRDQICAAWQAYVRAHKLKPGSMLEAFVADLLSVCDGEKAAPPVVGWWPKNARYQHGDFVKVRFSPGLEGRIVGAYQLDDEKEPGYALNMRGAIRTYAEGLLSPARF